MKLTKSKKGQDDGISSNLKTLILVLITLAVMLGIYIVIVKPFLDGVTLW